MKTTRQVPPLPIKIQHEAYADMPNSSAIVCPAESCSSDIVKQLKPRGRTASSASSVNSSEISDPLSVDDMEPNADADEEAEESEGLMGERKSAEMTVRSVKMQTHLQGMQRRLEILQKLMLEAAQQGSLRLHSGAATEANPCLFSVEMMQESNDKDQFADLQASAPNEREEESLGLTSILPSICATRMPNDEVNDSRDDQTDSSLTSSGEEGPPAITTLLIHIKTLQVRLKDATDENQQLQNTVHRLEQENARLQAQTAIDTLARDEDDSGSTSARRNPELNVAVGNDIGDDHDRSISRLASATFGFPSAFQIVMEEDLKILKDHERCQHKLHELWGTVRQLKTFVKTYEIERNAMRIQRDDAIAEAERADVENIRLTSSNNLQQKIKHLQQVKKDNQALRRKNRALNVRIAKEAVKLVWKKNGCSLHEDGDVTIETVDSALLDDTLQEFDEPSVRTGEDILSSMQNFSRFLEQRLERLRLARQDLPQDDDDIREASEFEGQMLVPVISEPSRR